MGRGAAALFWTEKKGECGGQFLCQEGTLLHPVEGSVGEWVGTRAESPGARIRFYGS